MPELLDDTALFAALTPPAPGLFYRRNDPNDLRLGEAIGVGQQSYAAAQVAVLGSPQDEGVRRNRGRPGASEAPSAIRHCLNRLSVNRLEGLSVVDLGDIRPGASLEETHALQQAVVRRVVSDGKRLIVLGGGNDISFPDCAGLAEASGQVLAFNIDTHLDVRADTPGNSGTPYRQLLEGGFIKPSAFFELGAQPFANSPVYERYLHDCGVTIGWLSDLRAVGVLEAVTPILASQPEPSIFWGFDMDSVRAADAPGVSAPSPIGLTAEEFCSLFTLAGAEPRTRVIEISEVNPTYDLDDRTSRLAAVAIWHFLAAFVTR
jgi:formiminoglutamase